MPKGGVVALLGFVGAELVLVDLLARLGADDADLSVGDAELGSVVQDGVDVQGRGGWLAAELAQTLDEMLLQLVC